MTTTITLETHSRPVRVTTNDNHSSRNEATGSYTHGYTTTSEVVPKNTKKQFHATSIRSVSFEELPEDWTPESDRPAPPLNSSACVSDSNTTA